MLDRFNMSIYINGIVVQTAPIASLISSYLIINRFPRRTISTVFFIILSLCSIVLIVIWDQDKQNISDIWSNIAVLIFVFLFQFLISS